MTDYCLNDDEEECVDTAKESQCILNSVRLEGCVCHSIVYIDADFRKPGRVNKLRELQLRGLMGCESARLLMLASQATDPVI